MKNRLLAMAIGVAALTPSSAPAQFVNNGYTILMAYDAAQYQLFVNMVQSELDAGNKFYRGGQDISYEGASQIVNELGPYYSYVYAPAHHLSASTFSVNNNICTNFYDYNQSTG